MKVINMQITAKYLFVFSMLFFSPVIHAAHTGNPELCPITSATALHAPDGSSDTRLIIGVGETVTFTTDQSASWTATTGVPKTGTGKTFTWKAECAKSTSVITAIYTGHKCSLTMKVIEPSGNVWKKDTDLNSNYPAKLQGSGMLLTWKVTPLSVNFAEILWREKSGPASARTGDFSTMPEGQPAHDASGGAGKPFGAWIPIATTGNDAQGKDTAASPPKDKPFFDGSFTWDIENQWKCKDADDNTAKTFTHTFQVFTCQGANGNLKVSKGGGRKRSHAYSMNTEIIAKNPGIST